MKLVFWAILCRDVKLAFRQGGGVGLGVAFFLMIIVLLPLGIGPDLALLERIAPGILWVALLLASLLSFDRLFHADFEDGTLDILMNGPIPLELVVLAKALAHWLTTGLVLVIVAPGLGFMLNLPVDVFAPLLITMLVGTPGLSLIGAIGAGLTISVRRGGLLMSILVLPLFVPILIFGISAVSEATIGLSPFGPSFMILCALTLATIVLAPVAAAAAIRASLL